MANERIRVDADDARLIAVLAGYRRRLSNLRPALRAAGEQLKARVLQRFTTKRSPGGTPWRPWAPSTRKQRIAEGTAHLGLLVRTGKLRKSLRIYTTERAVSVGFAASYARYHEDGTDRMPARRLLFSARGGLASGDARVVVDTLLAHIRGVSQ